MSTAQRTTPQFQFTEGLIHDIAVAQTAYLIAALSPIVSANVDRDASPETRRAQFRDLLSKLTISTVDDMYDLISRNSALPGIVNMGLKIAQQRVASWDGYQELDEHE
ncbi:hypothetical protein [Acidithiobacillus ferridurans]|uniref:Uncharacterized protein n=3 Tax=root TaxID=1 RepID=A0A8X8KA47_ACIFI|nr:hypothetical protein [Acidithiobacillus ferridurans]MBU2722482.1 hypothetical protein [Acidithiobacillus ferridurans]MBU2726674.1 hypothetical protein [Acidithiobacillus ferridurans]BBF63816.1 hypothetical protein AFERRID_00340 [Acidithiobacillus ferridurans]